MTGIKEYIEQGNGVLGIELGSTRIKAVLVDADHHPIAQGFHEWENRLEDGIWTYSLDQIWTGVQDTYANLVEEVRKLYDVKLTKIAALGLSGMMHGYMAFDQEGELLVPFRTWRNTMTEEASHKLTQVFDFHIPQRWSIAHLYQAVCNQEEHVKDISYITTLAGYLHWKLTNEKCIGICEASGMFPIDSRTKNYHTTMLEQFQTLVDAKYSWNIQEILPKVLVAGEQAGYLTEEGARLLDPTGTLEGGCVLCPPEGDAATGMVATNSVGIRTGNISAGTSVFAMVVLENPLQALHEELDLVTTPSGEQVAMVHCNNCTSDLNAWIGIFREFADLFGMNIDQNELFGKLYQLALSGDFEGGGLLAYNYLSGEHITGFEKGSPLLVRTPDSKFNLANFMRTHLFTSLGALKVGLDILLKEEGIRLDKIYGHGGFFKTPIVGQKIVAAAMNTPVSLMDTAGEGGAWGIALLAAYTKDRKSLELAQYLNEKVFALGSETTIEPDPVDVEGFDVFIARYRRGLPIEKAAIEYLS